MKQKTVNPQEYQKRQDKKAKRLKTRRVIKLLFRRCPVCNNRLSVLEPDINPQEMTKFVMVQFATNPDGTGYESYFCGMCAKFFMMILSPTPIMAMPNFVTGLGAGQQGPQQQQPQGGNGQAGAGGPF